MGAKAKTLLPICRKRRRYYLTLKLYWGLERL